MLVLLLGFYVDCSIRAGDHEGKGHTQKDRLGGALWSRAVGGKREASVRAGMRKKVQELTMGWLETGQDTFRLGGVLLAFYFWVYVHVE